MADLLDRLATKTKEPATGGDLLDRVAGKPQPEQSFGRRMLETGKGMIKGALQTADTLGTAATFGANRLFDTPGQQEYRKRIGTPSNPSQEAGMFGEHALEFAAPGAAGLRAARGAPLLARMGTEALGAGGVAAVQSKGSPRKTAEAAATAAAFPVAGAVGTRALRYATDLLGITTGVGGEAVRVAASTASQKFKDAMRNKTTEAEIVGDTRAALESVKNARGQAYRRQLSALPQVQINVVQPVKADLLNTLKNDYGIGVRRKITTEPTGILGPNGQPLTRRVPGNLELDFSHSTISDGGDQKKILDLVTDLDGWKDQSTTGVDTLKRRVDDLYAESSQARAIVQRTKDQIRSELNTKVPGYHRMTRDYALATKFIDEVNKEFSLKGGTGTVVRKLAYSLNQNNEYRKLMLEALGHATGTDLKEAVAGSAMRSVMPRGLVGRLSMEGGLFGAGGAAISGHPVGAIAGGLMNLLASSPRAVGEIMSLISTLRRSPIAGAVTSGVGQAGKGTALEATQQ